MKKIGTCAGRVLALNLSRPKILGMKKTLKIFTVKPIT
jgi:hypothetical protein